MSTLNAIAFDIPQTAAQLRTDALAVRRLVARRVLKATTLGAAGPTMITPDELQGYLAAGAPDFDAPEIAGTWFDGDEVRLANGFTAALRDAAEAQIPDLAGLTKLLRDNPKATSFELKVTPEITKLLTAPVPVSTIAPADDEPTRFKTWAELFVAVKLRDAARAIVGGIKAPIPLSTANTAPAIQRLYATPDDYVRVVDRAAADVLSRKAASITRYVLPPDAPNVLADKVTLDFSLPMSVVATPATLGRARTSAF